MLINQRPRQDATNSVEKDFFKLLVNANVGYDCKNKLDNCIFDKISEVSHIKNYNSLFDKSVSSFVNSKTVEE